jgi:hypothetical protein
MAKIELYDKKTLNEFGKDYVKILTTFLKKNKKVASGALVNSLNYKLKETAGEILIVLEANDYLEWVDKGRKPGKYPPIKAISQWAKIKGISQDAVWPIAHSIYKFGIKPTNVIKQTINEIQSSPTLKRKYEDELSSNIENIIAKEFKKLK